MTVRNNRIRYDNGLQNYYIEMGSFMYKDNNL